MSLSKSKYWYSNNCLHFLKCTVPFNIILLSFVLLSCCHISTIDDFLKYVTLLSPELEQLALAESTEGESRLSVYNPVIGFSFWAENKISFIRHIWAFLLHFSKMLVFICGKLRRNNIQHNDIKHNDIQHNDIQHNNIQHNDIQHNDTQHNDIQYNNIRHSNIQHNDIQHNNIRHSDIQHYDMPLSITISKIWHSACINNTYNTYRNVSGYCV